MFGIPTSSWICRGVIAESRWLLNGERGKGGLQSCKGDEIRGASGTDRIIGIAHGRRPGGCLRSYPKHLDLSIAQSPLDAQDQAVARETDRQGLGLTRWMNG
jgi:hypothetical protein